MLIKQRLDDLGLGQRDLARAAEVTESYVSQLLTRRRLPPAPNRTDIYEKMDRALKLPEGELAKLAAHQRKEQLDRDSGEVPAPLMGELRRMLLRKCAPDRASEVRTVFEKHPFGELERLVTNTIVDLVKAITREQLQNEHWLRTVAQLHRRSFREVRVVALKFLDTDVLDLVASVGVAFLEPFLKSWDIELTTFELEIELHPKVSPGSSRRFQFMERTPAPPARMEPGFAEFLADPSLSGTATEKELAFLGGLRFTTGQPTALYYYRELQSLRDPLHFRAGDPPRRHRPRA